MRTFSTQGNKGQILVDEEDNETPEVVVRDKFCNGFVEASCKQRGRHAILAGAGER